MYVRLDAHIWPFVCAARGATGCPTLPWPLGCWFPVCVLQLLPPKAIAVLRARPTAFFLVVLWFYGIRLSVFGRLQRQQQQPLQQAQFDACNLSCILFFEHIQHWTCYIILPQHSSRTASAGEWLGELVYCSDEKARKPGGIMQILCPTMLPNPTCVAHN